MTVIEVLTIESCPGAERALSAVHEALAQLAMPGVQVTVRTVRTEAAARSPAFAGSPTILLDGTDLLPTTSTVDSLACRLYATPTGLAPAPTPGQVETALRARLVAPAQRR